MMGRRLGRTGLDTSACTIGTAALARAAADQDEALAMFATAIGLGVNAVELDAGDDAAVDLLALAIARSGARDLHVFARVPSLVAFDLPSPHIVVDQAYPGRHIRAQTEALLSRLGVERLGLQQLHAWCPEWLDEGDWRETAARLRQEGKIAGIGISLFDHDPDAGLSAVASGAIDAVQVMYNAFDPAAAGSLLPLCAKHDVGVIARGVLYYGALAPPFGPFAADDWRRDYFYEAHLRETAARVEQLGQVLDEPLPEAALRFALSNPAVSTVAVGLRTRAQLEEAVAALAAGPLGADTLAAVARHAWLC